jgi:putative tricarboxylic transport membrane protein
MMKDWKAIGQSKDFWSGVIFLVAGLASVGFARSYTMGTTMRMGPGYFPSVLGGLLALIGLALMVRAWFQAGAPVGRLAFSKLALVMVSNVLFALLLRRLGLAGALILLVVVSAYASKRFRWPVALALAVGLAVGSSFIFMKLLGLPIPILGTWLGG